MKKILNKYGKCPYIYRNIAIHDYQAINVEILKTILVKHLKDLEDFYAVILVHFNFAKQ